MGRLICELPMHSEAQKTAAASAIRTPQRLQEVDRDKALINIDPFTLS
jgi:hypothetical protein